ncbi:MAG TPA: sigma-54-dependent Fis family transcriptional regulator [Thioalkalivibrio sp.]|nr:sigma-54-dependent Fis family transcriptional regulator [Thioalkalivibrio sp.]
MTADRILVVDDEPDIRNLVREILEDEGYDVAVAENAAAAKEERRHRRPDLILLDIWMPDMDGVSLLKEWRDTGGLPCPVIMMSGHATVETAVEATRLGAYDFIEKPISLAKLLLTVSRALRADQLARENQGLRREIGRVVEPIGASDVMRKLREQVGRLAQHSTCVLITGEPGAGKETVGRYLHSLSARRDRPFVGVTVASMSPETSAEEFFGSQQGDRIQYGLLEQAGGGILFLGGVGDMDLQTQGRLQDALESEAFTRVGGNERIELTAQIIASTDHDLRDDVKAGRFRDDLYYRLSVVPLAVPPLRDHAADVPELLNFYVDLLNSQEGLPYRRFSLAAQNRLVHYHWPGNVRELRNLVQRLLILGTSEEIGVDEVEAAVGQRHEAPGEEGVAGGAVLELPLREARERFERDYLLQQLERVGGNVSKLAERVGMERTHLYRKMRALGIDPKQAGHEK